MRWLLLLPLVVLALFFVDLDVASFFCHYKFALFKLITYLGNAAPYLLAGFGAYLYYRNRKPLWAKKGLYLFLSVLLSGIITTLLKILIGRPRPKMFFEHHLCGSPSGWNSKPPFGRCPRAIPLRHLPQGWL